MSGNELLQREVSTLIVETLNLDIAPEAIDPDAPLFGSEGLGLDSIDALELSLAISKKYVIELNSEIVQQQKVFDNLNTLAKFISNNRKD